jgi:serine/threonine-protein kinase
MIGTTLSHFRILAKIGEGGMGVVYRAEDEKLRRPVALKVLPPDLVGNEERRLRFLREARAAAAVSHPNIATIYEVGEAADETGRGPGVVFIAMELVEGKTLREVIGGRAMPMKDALRIAAEMADALAEAHKAGVIHRDLKPDNVIVGASGRAKILDFGLAKLLEERGGAGAGGGPGRGAGGGPDAAASRLETISGEMTQAGKILGTASYMSPEQTRGQVVDARSDIFSFGTTLYEMVTGSAPFQGPTATDMLSAIIRDQPSPASRANPSVCPELERIIGQCLEKDPQDRYQHTDQLAVDLRKLRRQTDSGAQAARAPSGPETAGGAAPPRARLTWMSGAAILAAGLLGIAVVAFALNLGGLRGWLQKQMGGAPSPGHIGSLAVLPLANLSGDPEQEYFTDGMTEELITSLSKISALRVISRTSAMHYKKTDKTIPEIAQELKVDGIVEGSVQRAGERVRITAQLIEGASDRHLWAESYERDLKDVLALQGEVARAIAGQIRATLTPNEQARLAKSAQVDSKAYDDYLRGRYYWNQRTEESVRKGIVYFESAIAKDPEYAPAYVGLADSYSVWGAPVLPPAEQRRRASTAVNKALAIDPTLGEAHASLASISMGYDLDWDGAEREFRKAIELNPGYPIAHLWYGLLLAYLGRHDEAMREMETARDLDPLSLIILASTGRLRFLARRYPEAVEGCRRTLDLDPEFPAALHYLGLAYEQQGKYAEAAAALEREIPRAGGVVARGGDLGHIYAAAGRKADATAILHHLQEVAKISYVSPLQFALIHLGLGENEAALRWVEKAIQEGADFTTDLGVDPRFDPLRSDPRFQEMLRRIGLAPGQAPAPTAATMPAPTPPRSRQ